MLMLLEKFRGLGMFRDTLTLPFEQRQKSRQRVVLDSGVEAGIALPPGTFLHDGDLLRGDGDLLVRVRAARERLSVARTADPLRLARACYHLGNRHVPLQVGPGWVRYAHDHVLDHMLVGLGLEVGTELAPFEPEPGAYAGEGERGHSGHAHGH
jgi:urease accessory protein